jgi:glutaredoxin
LRKGIDLDVRDISTDDNALEELTRDYQSWGTPTVVIGEKVIVGFDRERIDSALASLASSAGS